jgi:hypothetical protein
MHSSFSDGKLSLPKLIDLCGRSGLDAIAITDHLCTPSHFLGRSARFLNVTLTEKTWKDYVDEIEKQRNRAWREYKMIVFTGVEYTHNTFNHKRNAHILAVDIKEFIPPHLDEIQWTSAAKQLGALTIAAHPLKLRDASSQTYYLLENAEKFTSLIDVWEAANARTLWRKMLKQPFSLIASSDLHAPSKWPSWRTQVFCEKDPEAIKEYLRDRNSDRNLVFMYGKTCDVKNQVEIRSGQIRISSKKGVVHDTHSSDVAHNPGWLPSYV